jgi:hypothetical protein
LLGRLYVQFEASGNLLDLVQKQQEKVKLLDAALASGTFKDFVRKQDEIAAAMKRANAEAEKQAAMVRGERIGAALFGGPGAAVGGAIGGGLGAAGAAISAFTSALGGAISAMASFVEAASPEIMDTFMGSLQLLQAEIGKALVPLFVVMSYALQRLTEVIKPLTESRMKFFSALAREVIPLIDQLAAVLTPIVDLFRDVSDWLNQLQKSLMSQKPKEAKVPQESASGDSRNIFQKMDDFMGDLLGPIWGGKKKITAWTRGVGPVDTDTDFHMDFRRPRGAAPAYTGIADFARRLQLGILGRDEMQRKMVEAQWKVYEEAIKINRKIPEPKDPLL